MAAPTADLRQQIDSFFNNVTDTALDQALGADVPLVGGAVQDAVAGTIPFFAALKASILGVLDTIDSAASADSIASALDALDGVEATAADGKVSIHISGDDTFSSASKGFAVNAGSAALGVELDGSVGYALGAKLDVNLVFDAEGTHDLTFVDKGGDELSLSIDGNLTLNDAEAKLGFLGVKATDDLATPEIQLKAAVNITDGTKIAGLGADSFSTLISGDANLNVELETTLISDLLPHLKTNLLVDYQIDPFDPSNGLPGLGAVPNITLDDIRIDLGSFVDFLAGVFGPIVDDIFGSFPLGDLLDAVTAPIPVLDDAIKFIGALNFFDKAGPDQKITILDVAIAGGTDPVLVNAFANAFNLIKGISDAVGGGEVGEVHLGSIALLGDAPDGRAGLLAVPDYDYTPSSGNPLEDAFNGLKDSLGGNAPPVDGLPASVVQPLVDVLHSVGVDIPLLSDPAKVIPQLLLNNISDPVDLIVYDVPALGYDGGFNQFFPIIGPIGVGFEGRVFGGIDVKFGYDTLGLKTGNLLDGLFLTTEKLATPVKVGDEFAYYAPAATAGSTIAAYAGVSVGFASAAVYGGLRATLAAYFPDSDGQGKLHLSKPGCFFDPITGELGVEVYAKVEVGFGFFSFSRRFDIADVTLANFSFGCPPPSTDPQKGLATLGPVNGETTGELLLNAGERAGLRAINGTVGTDGVERFEVRYAHDKDGALIPGAMTVTSMGLTEQYGDAANPVTHIWAHMGNDRDTVVIAADITVNADLDGGRGDDLLVGGAGSDTIHGRQDADHLIGGAGSDFLYGDEGNDVLEGGLGADVLDGGADSDQVSYEHSAAGVTFHYENINGRMGFVGQGGDAEGDTLYSIEYIIGSNFNDVIYGNPNEDNTIEGLDGRDILVGGKGNDFLLGGGGADLLWGDGERGDDPEKRGDGTSYVSSAGQVWVDLANGVGRFGDADGDTYYSIEKVQGSFADDLLIGNNSDNTLDGWYGDDIIQGLGGRDKIFGGDGNDTIYGGTDGDTIDGGGSIYNPGRDLLTYALITGRGVTVNLLSGGTDDAPSDDSVTRAAVPEGSGLTGYSTIEDLDGSQQNDNLTGDNQYNHIRGLGGDDLINGAGGDDIIEGNGGADTMEGGAGLDTAYYRYSSDYVLVSLAAGIGLHGDAEGDKLSGIENLRGSEYRDTLIGNGGDNDIDPGLTGGPLSEYVSGNGGTDRMFLDYSRGDVGLGLIGGYYLGSSGSGSFARLNAAGTVQIDGVTFDSIERLSVVGTRMADTIYAGAGNDTIKTDAGDDTIYAGAGADRVWAGSGNDRVYSGTGADRALSAAGGNEMFYLNGGSGIDTLSISLASVVGNVTLRGTLGLSEFNGINMALSNGAAAVNFEVLGDVRTAGGDDRIIQPGRFDNDISTGFGVDVIEAGLGRDVIDGGLEYRIGDEILEPRYDGYGYGYISFNGSDGAVRAARNDGDQLVLDYRSSGSSVIGSVGSYDTGYRTEFYQGAWIGTGYGVQTIYSNQGDYTSGNDSTHFVNIERLYVVGSNQDDYLVGTDLYLGFNATINGIDVAAQSARGDDTLIGGAGNDRLLGRTGDDTLIGGDGNDVLVGAEIRRNGIGLSEIDRLTGGTGSDTFVLGSDYGILYGDLGTYYGQAGSPFYSADNRAIITDFDKSADKLALWTNFDHSDARLYRVEERGGSTFVYFHDGLPINGNPGAAQDELIAELVGVTGFDLNGSYVEYRRTFGDLLAQAPAGRIAPHALAADAAPAAEAPVTTLDVPAASWVTQTADLGLLKQGLFGGGFSPLGQGTLSIDGSSVAFGTFSGDPFGLGSGIVLSTGNVEDLAGPNLVDGGTARPQNVALNFTAVGDIGASGGPSNGATIYRADLSGLGIDLRSLLLADNSGGFGGGVGKASGFDIDAIVLSNQKIDNFTSFSQFNDTSFLKRLDVFDFNMAAVQFRPGEQRPGDSVYPNSPDLLNTTNGMPNFLTANLGFADSNGAGGPGSITLGDKGSIGFDLRNPVSTDGPLYLYVVESGGQQGEKLTTGLTASDSRLDAPADLSTDLGAPGVEGDTTTLTYRFTPTDVNGNVDASINQVGFDFVFFSEELVEFAQSGYNDDFKIMLNGVNLARLSDGSFASVDTIYTPAAGPGVGTDIFNLYTGTPPERDFVYNPVGTGPAASQTRADGYTKVLHFTAPILAGQENVLTIEARDVRDGLLDSGILIRGGSITGSSALDFSIDRDGNPLAEGGQREVDFHLNVPTGATPSSPVTVTLDPTDGLDLGAGAGVAVTRTIAAGGPFEGSVIVKALMDGHNDGQRLETIAVKLAGGGLADNVAPLAVLVDDRIESITRTIGDAPERFSRANPNAWHDAWTADGIAITHTANHDAAAPAYSAIDLGTVNPGVLSGSDLLAGDLGVSGMAGATTTMPQDIAGTEALRFAFASNDATAVSIDFARFEAGDSALVQLYDAAGALLRSEVSSAATYSVGGLHDIASVVVSAATGAFMVDSVTVSENVEASGAAGLVGVLPHDLANFHPAGPDMIGPPFWSIAG